MRHLWILFFIFSVGASARENVENFVLLDAQGVAHELYRLKEAKAVVIMAHGLGCPIVDQSIGPFNEIAAHYKKRGIEFLFLNPSGEDTAAQIESHMREFNNQIPVLLDSVQVVARSLQMRRTTEIVVIQPSTWKIVFRGPMDDGTRAYGAARRSSQKDYLKETLDAVLKDRLEQIPRAPEVLGCLLNLDANAPPSYSKTIAPILRAKCYRCHDGRDSSAWKMDNYASVKRWAPMIRETLMTRRMPPWWTEPGADSFVYPGALSHKEQSQLFAWVEAGAPGDRAHDPLLSVKVRDSLPVDRLLHLERPVDVPANGEIAYQYSKLLVADRDLYIRRIRAISGTSSIHHAELFAASDSLHADPEKIYYDLNPSRLGGIKQIIPQPYVYFLPKGQALYLQMHFRTLGHPIKFDPVFALSLAKPSPNIQVLHELKVLTEDIHVPAGDPEFKMNVEGTRFDHPVEIVALAPHMHFRGKSMKIKAVYPNGSVKMLLSIPKYDPYFQANFWFKKPVSLPSGSRLVVTGSYDNSKSNPLNPDPERVVPWGRQMSDEMFLVTVTYVDRPSLL